MPPKTCIGGALMIVRTVILFSRELQIKGAVFMDST